MNKPKDRIEELYQSHSDDFDKIPDDSLWADIEANLPPAMSPVHRLRRWSMAAALLLFSSVGYLAYESISGTQKTGLVGSKENMPKTPIESQKPISKKAIKTESEANEINLTEEQLVKETIIASRAKNDKIVISESAIPKDKVVKGQKDKIAIPRNRVIKSAELLTQEENRSTINHNKRIVKEETEKQIAANTTEVNQVKESQTVNRVEEENSSQQNAVRKADDIKRLSAIDYLSTRSDIAANEIPLNTHIAYEAEHQPIEKKESFFKIPSEVYISLTPSLNYYRVFSSTIINQFNGANNGGRVGWAVQAGAVYPLKFKRFNYRVGLSYFSAQSNFKYNVVNRTQMPVRLNNNTFEYVNVESLQSESKKWQVLEIQNDLMYKVRPTQDFILGLKAGSSFTEKPVFDTYTGYRFSKQFSNRQVLWIEAAYAYAINAQKSGNNTFSYHMDKYSLRIGVNFR